MAATTKTLAALHQIKTDRLYERITAFVDWVARINHAINHAEPGLPNEWSGQVLADVISDLGDEAQNIIAMKEDSIDLLRDQVEVHRPLSESEERVLGRGIQQCQNGLMEPDLAVVPEPEEELTGQGGPDTYKWPQRIGKNKSMGRRQWKVRESRGNAELAVREYLYRSPSYYHLSERLGLGRHTTHKGKKVVWLTVAEWNEFSPHYDAHKQAKKAAREEAPEAKSYEAEMAEKTEHLEFLQEYDEVDTTVADGITDALTIICGLDHQDAFNESQGGEE